MTQVVVRALPAASSAAATAGAHYRVEIVGVGGVPYHLATHATLNAGVPSLQARGTLSATGEATPELYPTADLLPSGLVYKLTVRPPGSSQPWTMLFAGFTGVGPVQAEDFQTDPPGALPPSGLAAHQAATPGHSAAQVSFVPTGTVAATDVQAAIVEVAFEAGAASHPNLAAHDTLGLATQAELDAEATSRSAADALLIPLAQRGAANGVATLGADSKVPSAQIPAIAISDYLGAVASQAAMLALVGQRGDWATRTDLSATFILAADDASLIGSWVQLPTPADAVLSVDGATGVVVLASDGPAGTATKRSLGTGATQAAAGNDARLTDARSPTLHAGTHAAAGTDPVTLTQAQVTGLEAALAGKQAQDADLDAIAALVTTAFGRSVLTQADAAALRTLAGLVIGTNVAAQGDARFTTLPLRTLTASGTLVLADAGGMVEMNVAAANTLTIPPNSSVAFPVGATVAGRSYGAGQTTITPGVGVTVRSEGGKLKSAGQYAEWTMTKRAVDEWVSGGALVV